MAIMLITGAGSGIGLTTALHFARKGYTVYAGVHSLDRAAELQRFMRKEPLPIAPIEMDVDDDRSVQQAVSGALERSGRVDVLVNNAGILGGGSIEQSSLAEAKRLFETNYFGAMRAIQAVLPGMRERRSGTIVNVTSISGQIVMAGYGHYAASKHALEATSEMLAQEVRAFNIRVAIIAPGTVLTPIFVKNKSVPDPASPYAAQARRLGLFFARQLQKPTMPQQVAEAIEHAITTDRPKLRYCVGRDAEALVGGRQRLTDEEWIEFGREMSDAEYVQRMNEHFGAELF